MTEKQFETAFTAAGGMVLFNGVRTDKKLERSKRYAY